nr:MAG TPA: hypothetical protein [Caudoviricetes sp.]
MDEFRNKIIAELNKRNYSSMTLDEIGKAVTIYSTINAYNSSEMLYKAIKSGTALGFNACYNSDYASKAGGETE